MLKIENILHNWKREQIFLECSLQTFTNVRITFLMCYHVAYLKYSISSIITISSFLQISYHGSGEGGESDDSEGENQELAQIDRGKCPLPTKLFLLEIDDDLPITYWFSHIRIRCFKSTDNMLVDYSICTLLQPPLHLLLWHFLFIDSFRETEKLCPHPLGHQPAAQPGSPLSSPVTTPPPPFRCQSRSPLFRRRAWANQLRWQQEVGVIASPAPRWSPQQRLQWWGGAGPLWLRVTGCLCQATGWAGCLPGCLP